MGLLEQYRRRLISGGAGESSGYITFGWDGYVQDKDSGVRICGLSFNMGQIASIKRNNENVPIAPIVELPGGQSYDIRIDYKALINADEICQIYPGASGAAYRSLVYLDVSELNTAKVVSMEALFVGIDCSIAGLNSLSTVNVESMRRIFDGRARSFLSGEIDGWDTSNVRNFSYAFRQTRSSFDEQYSIDISGWDTSSATTMAAMFKGHKNLVELRMYGATNPNADVDEMFQGVTSYGTFYYNPAYDYSHIIAQLPSTWTAIAVTQ